MKVPSAKSFLKFLLLILLGILLYVVFFPTSPGNVEGFVFYRGEDDRTR